MKWMREHMLKREHLEKATKICSKLTISVRSVHNFVSLVFFFLLWSLCLLVFTFVGAGCLIYYHIETSFIQQTGHWNGQMSMVLRKYFIEL